MSTAAYQIDVKDLFSGPIDLLYYLVRKQEVDILAVSVAEISRQFLDYLEVLEIIDFDLAADFLVTASAILEIKSRVALIRDEEEQTEEEEEVDEPEANQNLVLHLLEYQQLREAAETLQEQALAWQDRYPRLADDRPTIKRSAADDLIKDLEIWDLVGAFARIVKRKVHDQEATVKFDETPIHVYVDQIGARVREAGRVRFQDLFDKTDDRSKAIGMFLAILELVRHHEFRAEQENDFEEIWILPPLENAEGEHEDTA